jgi:DNA-binding PadR family transcriptional regulator
LFKRDIDQFRFETDSYRFMGQEPPEHHGPHHPPPFGGIPFFGSKPPFFSNQFKLHLPVGRESFQEIRDFIVLLIISEYPYGITGYQLQDKYNFPRGTLVRTLQALEDKQYLKSREEILEGRANKFYIITELGKKFLEELKLKWANVFSIMSEINPPEGLKRIIFEKVEEFESKEDAIDFFRGIRSWMKSVLNRIELRIEKLKGSKADLDRIVKEIEEMESLDQVKIKDMINKSIEKFEGEE